MEKKTKKTKSTKINKTTKPAKSTKAKKVKKATKATIKKELSVKERKKVSAGTNGLYQCQICKKNYPADQMLLKKKKVVCIYCASKM